ncbi:MAG: MotA/TolQ/ExbB proton channel family protein, partial [Planctomycetota bacterium]
MPPSNFISILFAGGWVGTTIVLLLLVLSFTALYLIIEQFLFLRRSQLVSREVRDRIRALIDEGRVSQACEACANRNDTLAQVLGHALREADGGWSAVEKAAEDALAHEASRIGRRAEYLAVIGNLAPMVGLLGTVTGMIFAFQKVATTQGSAGAADLAEGIYQALVTTVCGLLVAIPSLGAYAVLRNRADTIVAEAAFAVAYVLSPLKRLSTRTAATPRNPRAVPPEV